MPQKVSILLVDDIDESEASKTITFGLGGVNYEIDLNDEHASALREALAPWVGRARKAGGQRRARKAGVAVPKPASDRPSPKEILEWARENGWDVPDRGRISADVREASDTAHRLSYSRRQHSD